MKPIDKPHLAVGALSHPGERRNHNEDRYSVTAYQRDRDGMPSLLAVVADGIGGHQAGEVAAEMTVEHIVEAVTRSDGDHPLQTLREAVTEAAIAVHEASTVDPQREGMGSTVSIAWILGDRLFVTYVGDSRIYLMRGDQLIQITNDHTWVQEAVDHQIISPEEAHGHPHAHVLRRHIGGEEPPEPDQRLRVFGGSDESGSRTNQGLKLREGDRLLLCSDGLTDLVEDEELAAALGEAPPEGAAERLVALARERGGHDNITVVALEVPQGALRSLPAKKSLRNALLALALVAIFAGAVGLGAVWWFGLGPFDPPGGGARPSTATPTSAGGSPTSEAVTATTASPTAAATPAATTGPTSTPIPLATVIPEGG